MLNMDPMLIIAVSVTVIWVGLLYVQGRMQEKYTGCRKEAFRAMNKTRIIVYGTPLIVSVFTLTR